MIESNETPSVEPNPLPSQETAVAPVKVPAVVALVGEMPFCGAAVARVLLEDGFSVRALCPDAAAESALKNAAPAASKGTLTCVRGALDSAASIDETLSGAWGAAFLSPVALEGRVYRSAEHFDDIRRVCDAIGKAQVKRVLYHSQLSAEPMSPCVALQHAAVGEEMMHALGREVFRFRTGVLMGAGDHLQSNYVRAAQSGSPFMSILGYGSTTLQPLHVNDMAQCVARIFSDAPKPLTPGLFTVAGPELTTPLDLIDMALAKAGRFKVKVHAPLFVLKLLASAGGNQAFKEKVLLLFAGFCTDQNDTVRLLGPLYRLITPQQSLEKLSGAA